MKPDIRKLTEIDLLSKGDTKAFSEAREMSQQTDALQGIEKTLQPIAALAEVIVGQSESKFEENADKIIERSIKKITKNAEKLASSLAVKEDNLAQFKERLQKAIRSELPRMVAAEVSSAVAALPVPEAPEPIRLSEEEIEDIIRLAALSAESQLSPIIKDYVDETRLTTDDIDGLDSFVRSRIPAVSIDWKDIKNKPSFGGLVQIGGGKNQLKFLNDVDVENLNTNATIQYQPVTGKWSTGISITVSDTAPTDPKIGDLWIDTA